MQFIMNGPDVPDDLLEAHEEGRVVFFCGAGISYPAGLPSFGGLVEKIYKDLGTEATDIEKNALKRMQFDIALNLLETRYPGQRLAIRKKLCDALFHPNLRKKGALDTHIALLHLGKCHSGDLKLVTTNFDKLFQIAGKRKKISFESYKCPLLPIPKNGRWDGVVYLHGLIEQPDDETCLNRLVVTSGDFGLAYLTERWAARFVSELFRNYVVCFVGYSINDPVLRYMMDALAADEMLGTKRNQAWAFGDFQDGQKEQKIIEWKARGVTPILYNVPVGSHDHSALHKTLHIWAETHRNGSLGKEKIIANHVLAKPSTSTQQDNFVGRVLWAISDKSGIPAKHFANFNPVPSLEWLFEVFSKNYFGYKDLSRFGIISKDKLDEKLEFSLISRPSPHHLSPRMELVSSCKNYARWDKVMENLAQWLVRHINDPRLILWVVNNSSELHEEFIRIVSDWLNHIYELQLKNDQSELERLQAQAPNSVPDKLMKTLWSLLLNGHIKKTTCYADLFSWKSKFNQEGLTSILRLELRQLLSPCVMLKYPFHSGIKTNYDNERDRIKKFLDWDWTIRSNDISSITHNDDCNLLNKFSPSLLTEFQQLLIDTLDLMRELEDADDHHDLSYLHLPSISQHKQNRYFHSWVYLINLTRDAWIAIYNNDKTKALQIAKNWFSLPYPTFKRLSFFAASKDNCIPADIWLKWLLADNFYWLWSMNTKREVCRLLVLQGNCMSAKTQKNLEKAILKGPPNSLFLRDSSNDDLEALKQRAIWLYLSKLQKSGASLGEQALSMLEKISTSYPKWKLMPDESDEFAIWTSGTGDPDFEESQLIEIAPKTLPELTDWLMRCIPMNNIFYEDDWLDLCKEEPDLAYSALSKLAENNIWLEARWEQALQVWNSDENNSSYFWSRTKTSLKDMPEKVLQNLSHSLSMLLKKLSKSHTLEDEQLVKLCAKILTIQKNIDNSSQPILNNSPVVNAINHPIGNITTTLLNLWLNNKPKDNDGLPDNIKKIFTDICNIDISIFIHGRVILGSQLIALFRADKNWTENNLLPLFNWEKSKEASALWQGFLWSPRIYLPLLNSFKNDFLITANHYDDLGEFRQQFALFLVYSALQKIDGFLPKDIQSALSALPAEGLSEAVKALIQVLERAEGHKKECWDNLILPFWKSMWPQNSSLATEVVVESLAQLTITAVESFPEALETFKYWLKKIEDLHYTLYLLKNSDLCKKYPKETLFFLELIVPDDIGCFIEEIIKCLSDITKSKPELIEDDNYKKLKKIIQDNGGSLE